MTTYDDVLQLDPFCVSREEKSKILTAELLTLTEYHSDRCAEYRKMLDAVGFSANCVDSYLDIPFLPVRLFKDVNLRSIPQKDIFKTLTSSGTSGQKTARIFLDRETAANQQKALIKIAHSFLKASRMPMLVVDSPSVLKERLKFSARGAGILGFSMFSRERIYALRDDMTLDLKSVQEFLERHKNERILIFGFTFMVWEYLYKALIDKGASIDCGNSILVHGGGWKKLSKQAVLPEKFRQALKEQCGIAEVSNYYGMAEQTGCIYMECEYHYLHASSYSDIIVRRVNDFSVASIGERGIIQVVSPLPKSYPGHSLLTEDEGEILGEDDCPCGRMGKYFRIHGRMKGAELRGCSDTYERR